jgi:hypothetical protein
MNSLSFRPQLHSFDNRIVPSVTSVAPPSGQEAVAAQAAIPKHPLDGMGTGQYHVAQTQIADGGTRYDYWGKITLKGLGTFDVTGHTRGVGNAGPARATGQLVLTNEHGSITISLQGTKIQAANSPVPNEFAYRISKATGDYSNLYGGYGVMQVGYSTPTKWPAGAVVGQYQMNLL